MISVGVSGSSWIAKVVPRGDHVQLVETLNAADMGEPRPRIVVAERRRGIGALRNAVAGTLDAELVHSTAQRVGMEREDLRRPFRSLDQPACLLQRSENVGTLRLLEGRDDGRSTGRRLASGGSGPGGGHREQILV